MQALVSLWWQSLTFPSKEPACTCQLIKIWIQSYIYALDDEQQGRQASRTDANDLIIAVHYSVCGGAGKHLPH